MERPWVRPDEVREYTGSTKVKGSTDAQLKVDIMRAESYVIYHTHNRFDAETYVEEIPEEVKIAVILLAEAYALKRIAQIAGNVTSETFDDYSYTVDTDTDVIDNLQIESMLDPYVIEDKGKAIMRLRKL